MDIYTYAMQMEKDGENYYHEIAQRTKHPGVRNIVLMLAEAEVRHYQTFQHLRNHETAPLADLVYLSTIKNIFVRMREGKEALAEDGDETKLYRKAQTIEEKTRDFYRAKAPEVPANQREVLLTISNEEQKHYDILENIIQMVTRPDNWLENAEWYQLEEY